MAVVGWLIVSHVVAMVVGVNAWRLGKHSKSAGGVVKALGGPGGPGTPEDEK